jgi:BTB/POZ domain
MEIQCRFGNNEWDSIVRYTCFVESSNITIREDIRSYIGNHEAGRADQDVEVLYIQSNPNFHFIPRGIGRIFPNVIGIWIYDTGLREIQADDLLGLDNLEKIWLCINNQLTSLPLNLFMHTRQLKDLYIEEHHLKRMNPRMFNLIADNQWNGIHLKKKNNVILYQPGSGRGLRSMREVKNAIRAEYGIKVDKTELEKASVEGFKILWQQKKFCDFTIIAGAKEIPVHKSVLAVRSSVFANMFETDEDVKATNKLVIEDCSEEAVEEFLQCLYTGEINEENEPNFFDLFRLASTFEVLDLQHVYEQFMLDNTNEAN